MSPRRGAGRRPDPDQLQQWVVHDRVPPGQVGARLGLSRAYGYAWLHRYGITPDRPVVTQARLVARWWSGIPAQRLAADLDLPADAVRERLVTAEVLTSQRSYFIVGSRADPLPQHLLRELHIRQQFAIAQIAVVTGLTARQVRYRLTRYRLGTAKPGPKPTVPALLDRSRLAHLYLEQQLTCPQIADRYGHSTEAVRRLLDTYGIDRRPSGTRHHPPLTPAAVRAYQNHRLSLTELARRLGYLTAAGNPAVHRLRSALADADITRCDAHA